MTVIRTLALLLFFSSSLFAQDTLRITRLQADSLIIARNLTLIASRYDVDMAAAARIQAKLFSNPELNTEWNLYNPARSKWLDAGSTGQKIISLQKVFHVAGQRNTSIKLAEEVRQMTEFQYEALARSLRYELHVTFYRYYYLNRAVSSIDSQLKLLKNLIKVYSEQYQKRKHFAAGSNTPQHHLLQHQQTGKGCAAGTDPAARDIEDPFSRGTVCSTGGCSAAILYNGRSVT